MLECTKFDFGWGSAPYHLAEFKGPTSKGYEGREGKERRGRQGKKREKKGLRGRELEGEGST